MSNEIVVNASLAYSDSEGTEDSLACDEDLQFTITTKRITRLKQNVGTTEEAVNLGDVSSPGYAIFINRDTTNYIELKCATSGTIFAKLLANGGCALVYLGSGAQVPYAIANTGACQMDVLILSQ